MAGALRPVVLFMALASLLFIADAVLDGVYPGGGAWPLEGSASLAWTSYVFAVINAAVALLIARGSERSLVARIVLSGFFFVERPISAVALGDKTTEAIAVHAVTAVVELVILVSALRIWRLGRSFDTRDMEDVLSLSSPTPPPEPVDGVSDREITGRGASGLAVLALAVAAVLVAEGVTAGYIPGGRPWGLTGESAGWAVYVYALIVLLVGVNAVRGRMLSLRLLMGTALILFIERSVTPLLLRIVDPLPLGLHALAAFAALALALATASAMRAQAAADDGVASTT